MTKSNTWKFVKYQIMKCFESYFIDHVKYVLSGAAVYKLNYIDPKQQLNPWEKMKFAGFLPKKRF